MARTWCATACMLSCALPSVGGLSCGLQRAGLPVSGCAPVEGGYEGGTVSGSAGGKAASAAWRPRPGGRQARQRGAPRGQRCAGSACTAQPVPVRHSLCLCQRPALPVATWSRARVHACARAATWVSGWQALPRCRASLVPRQQTWPDCTPQQPVVRFQELRRQRQACRQDCRRERRE